MLTRQIRSQAPNAQLLKHSATRRVRQPSQTFRLYASKPSSKTPPARQQPNYKGRAADVSKPQKGPSEPSIPDSNPTDSTTTPPAAEPLPDSQTQSFISSLRLFPNNGNPQRGYEIASQVVRTGKLPKEYRPFAWRITAIIISIPVIIVLTPALWERVVLGKERKKLVRGANEDEDVVEVVTEEQGRVEVSGS